MPWLPLTSFNARHTVHSVLPENQGIGLDSCPTLILPISHSVRHHQHLVRGGWRISFGQVLPKHGHMLVAELVPWDLQRVGFLITRKYLGDLVER